MATAEEYVQRAKDKVISIVDKELAVVHPELESRISEAFWPGSSDNIDPHHVTTAVRQLAETGQVGWNQGSTRGGRVIGTLEPANRIRRSTAIDIAAARKRLLFTRYLSWAKGSKRHPEGLIGPAGEAATTAAIIESGALQPAVPGAGAVKTLLGVTLNGPLDSAGYIVPVPADGIPRSVVTALFEVKNVRSWIYPTSQEPYQLLSKAVTLQAARPNVPILPILVCRRAHATTFWMAKQLGFVVIDMQRQFLGSVDRDQMIEIRNELHFNDLEEGEGPSRRVRDRLKETLPARAHEFAETWRRTALDPEFGPLLQQMSKEKKDIDRLQSATLLKQLAVHRGDRGW